MLVSHEDVQKFDKDGAIILRNVFSKAWVEKVREGIQINLEKPSQYSEKLALKEGQGSYFNDFAFNSPAAEIAARLMKSKYAVFYHEHVLNKEPGTEKETPWHQDQAYYPVDGFKVLSIWMPVDPVSEESSVKFVKGSHKWGKWFHPRKFASESNYPVENDNSDGKTFHNVPVDEIENGKFELLSWACQPGDCVVFHGMTMHGAKGNRSTSLERRVLSTRWVGEGITIAKRPWTVSPPILGGLDYGDRMISDTFPLAWGSI